MRVFDAILFVLLLIGNILALPLWWWLFGAPFVRLWKAWPAGVRYHTGQQQAQPPDARDQPDEIL